MKFIDYEVLLRHVRTLAYAFSQDLESTNIIGLDNENNLVYSEINSKDPVSRLKINLSTLLGKEHLVNAISQTIEHKEDAVIFTTKHDGKFNTRLGFFQSSNYLPQVISSDCTPMIIADPDKLGPRIIYSDGNKLLISKVTPQGFENINFTSNINRVPKGIHYSAITDLVGNLNPLYVLHTEEKYIDIYKNLDGKDNLIQSIELPNAETSPVLFSEISHRISSDMLFVAYENGRHFLYHYRNLIAPALEDGKQDLNKIITKQNTKFGEVGKVYDTYKRYDLSEIFPEFVPVLRTSDNLPTGLFLADISASGTKEALITLKKTDVLSGKDEYTIKSLKYDHQSGEFIPNVEFNSQLPSISSEIQGITLCDIFNERVQQIVITTKSQDLGPDSHSVLLVNIENMNEFAGISFGAVLTNENRLLSYIPGSSIIFTYENNQFSLKSSLSAQSGFPSLQPYQSFVGLGPTNLFVNVIKISIPHRNEVKRVHTENYFCIPNTFVLFSFNLDSWSTQGFFSKKHYNTTLVSLIFIIAFFFGVYILLSIYDAKRYTKVMNNDKSKTIYNTL